MTQPDPIRPVAPGPEATPLGRTFLNGIWLLGANGIASGAQYLIVVLAARALGPETFGIYVFAVTFASFFATICNFGIDRVLIREIVRRPAATSIGLLAAICLRLLLGILSVVLGLAVASGLGYAPEMRLAITLLLFSQILGLFAELFRSVLFASGSMSREARLRTIGRFAAVAAVTSSLVLGGDLLWLASALAIGGLLELLLYVADVVSRHPLRGVRFDRSFAAGLARSAWPIAINTALVVLYLRINVVMLTAWTGAEAVGLFGAAFTFIQVLQVVSGSLAGVLLPTLTSRYLEGPERVRSAVRRATFYVLLFVLPTTVGMSLLAGQLVAIVYGAQYSGAVPALAVLAWANPFMFLGSLFGTLLIVLDAERLLIPLSSAALIVSGIVNYLLVPTFGMEGAAWATVVTEFTVAAGAFWAAHRRLGPLGWRALMMRPVIVAFVVGAALLGGRGGGGFAGGC
jgi:O-antigen/teichoic acid export membrane protein